jgi:hypothetical protein
LAARAVFVCPISVLFAQKTAFLCQILHWLPLETRTIRRGYEICHTKFHLYLIPLSYKTLGKRQQTQTFMLEIYCACRARWMSSLKDGPCIRCSLNLDDTVKAHLKELLDNFFILSFF